MTLTKLLVFSAIATVVVAVPVFANREIPLSRMLMPVKNVRAFYCQLLVAIAVSFLMAAHYLFGMRIFDQQARTWAMLLMLLYIWACLGWHYSHSK